MNSTLILLNTLALAVLVAFHFQPVPSSAEQPGEFTATFKKPLAQVAVLNGSSSAKPHLTTEHPAVILAPAGERWVF